MGDQVKKFEDDDINKKNSKKNFYSIFCRQKRI